jgi:cobalt-zinc-cadmium efflux system membrane fusion protein
MNRCIALLIPLAAVLAGCTSPPDTGPRDEEEHADEERTMISADAARAAGVETATAGAGVIRETITLHGTVVLDPQRVYRLRPRFDGVVREMRRRLSESVRAGEVVAIVEANDSLQRYDIVAPADGIVVARDANPGMQVGDEPILTIGDLSTVWVELAAFQHDLGRIAAGLPVVVRDVDGHQQADGRVDSVAAVGSPASQSMTVRVVLQNGDGRWRPGLFVSGEIVVAETPVAVVVKRVALQTLGGRTVVFEQDGERYEVRPVVVDRRDAEHVEVREGLIAGARYVTTNSYVVKADIE